MTILQTGYRSFNILNIISYPSYIDIVNPLNQIYNEIRSIKLCLWNTLYDIKLNNFKYVDLEHIKKNIYIKQKT